ncbi:MAG: hypothetical protein ACREQB_12965 [Candidatus Binataceae bacterium]
MTFDLARLLLNLALLLNLRNFLIVHVVANQRAVRAADGCACSRRTEHCANNSDICDTDPATD